MSSSFNSTVLTGFQPNYAIKRDLREKTGFKFYIGRVGPLFWLLAVMKYFSKTRFAFVIISTCFLITVTACTKSGEATATQTPEGSESGESTVTQTPEGSESGESTVTQTPEGSDPYIREDLGYPPKKDDWYFEVSAGDAGWTYRFMMFEGAELYLGTEIFNSLPERFSKISGVTKVEQEDRESYLINSTLSPNELDARLWSAFQSAASESLAE